MTLEELKVHREYFEYFRDLPHGVMGEIFDAFEEKLKETTPAVKPKKTKTEAE